MLLKSSELLLLVVVVAAAVVGSEWQESMRSEVEHSWTFLFHLLVFLLCLHHPCLSYLSFLCLFLFSGNIHTHLSSTDLHRPSSLHSSSDHRPNSHHRVHVIHLLHSILLQILLTHHVRAVFSSSFSSALLFLDLKNLRPPLPFPFPFLLPLPLPRLVCLPWNLL